MLTARLAERPLALSCAASFFAALGFALASVPAVPLLAAARGASLPETGLAVAAPLLIVALLSRVPAVRGAETRRLTALAGSGVTAVIVMLFPLAATAGQILILRLVQGVALAAIPLAVATAAGALHEWHRGRALALPALLAWAVGPLLGGVLVDRAGLSTAFGAAACCSIVAFVSLAALPAVPARDDATEGAAFYNRLSAAPVALRLALGALEAFLPLYALGLGLGARHVGLLFAICTVWATVGSPFWRRLAQRAPAGTLVLGLMLAALATALVGLSAAFSIQVLAMAMLGAATAGIYLSYRGDRPIETGRVSPVVLPPTLEVVAHAGGVVAAGLALPGLGSAAVFQVAGVLLAAAALVVAATAPRSALGSGSLPPA